MKSAVRTILGVAVSMALAFVLVIAVELFSSVVHPFPPGFAGTKDEVCAHVARYPDWVLGAVVVAWSTTALVSTWVATRIGNHWAGMATVLLLALAIVSNISMLPYALWFKVAMPIGFAAACYWGMTRGRRTPLPVANS